MIEQPEDKSVVTPKTSRHIKRVTLPFIVLNAPAAYLLYQINITHIGLDLSFLDEMIPPIKYLSQADEQGRSNRLYFLLAWALGYVAIYKPAAPLELNEKSVATNTDLMKSAGFSLFVMATSVYVCFFALTDGIKYSGRDGIIPTLISEGPAGVGLILSLFVWLFYIFLIIFVACINKAYQNRRTQ